MYFFLLWCRTQQTPMISPNGGDTEGTNVAWCHIPTHLIRHTTHLELPHHPTKVFKIMDPLTGEPHLPNSAVSLSMFTLLPGTQLNDRVTLLFLVLTRRVVHGVVCSQKKKSSVCPSVFLRLFCTCLLAMASVPASLSCDF